MAVPTWSQQIDNIFTTTWSNRQENAEQQAYLKTPLLDWLQKKGKVKKISGYTRLEIPLEYGSNETTRWISKGSTIPITEGELLTMAYEDWKYVATSIIRYGTDDQKNRGKARIINYVTTKINAAERSLNETFESAFWGDGSGTDEPNGFQNLISTTPTTGTVHGINRATYSWFRNQTKASSGAASVYLLSDMRNLLNTCTKYTKTEMSDYAVFTDQTSYELYEDEVMEQKQIVNQKEGDPFFGNVVFKGVPLSWANSAPAGRMYFINRNYLYLIVDSEYWMQMTDWKAIPNQVNDRVAQILCTCNLVCSRPTPQGVLTGITA